MLTGRWELRGLYNGFAAACRMLPKQLNSFALSAVRFLSCGIQRSRDYNTNLTT
jgi:hypothetical protein